MKRIRPKQPLPICLQPTQLQLTRPRKKKSRITREKRKPVHAALLRLMLL